MADFKQAYRHLIQMEGGYVNDPDDMGGETYRGVARRYHPDWDGWSIIDAAKKSPLFPMQLYENELLEKAVIRFYKRLYWDVHGCDNFSSQQIAEEMFEQSVHLGQKTAAKNLQRIINALNNRGILYPEVTVDGDFGPKSRLALQKLTDHGRWRGALKLMNSIQGVDYLEKSEKDDRKEKYLNGWLNRVSF